MTFWKSKTVDIIKKISGCQELEGWKRGEYAKNRAFLRQ